MNSKAKRNAANVFDSYLTKDETILWMGKPNPLSLFSAADIFMIPFSLMWGGFAIFWESLVLSSGKIDFLSLWGIPFVLFGQYVIWGRFVHEYLRRMNTYYALTDKRALVLERLFGSSLNIYFLRKIPSLERQGWSVLFGPSASLAERLKRQHKPQPGFYSISDADEVYRLMQELMMQQESKIA